MSECQLFLTEVWMKQVWKLTAKSSWPAFLKVTHPMKPCFTIANVYIFGFKQI